MAYSHETEISIFLPFNNSAPLALKNAMSGFAYGKHFPIRPHCPLRWLEAFHVRG